MKRTILKTYSIIFLIAAFVSSFMGQAQSVIYNANFSNVSGPNAWSFSSNVGSWVVGSLSNIPTNTITPNSGSYFFIEHGRRNKDGTYPPNMESYVYTPVINLAGWEHMQMSFEYFLDLDDDDGEAFKIEFSTNGSTWYVLGKENDEATNWYPSLANGVLDGIDQTTNRAIELGGWTSDTGTWDRSGIDLPSQGFNNNNNVRFRIKFASDGNTNSGAGLLIDNFKITGYPIEEKIYSDCGSGLKDKLELWLNPETLEVLNDGQPVDEWFNSSSLNPIRNVNTEWTSAYASGAERPLFFDNPSKNVNFNPVVSFDGTKSMFGRSGFYSQDIFIVINPTNTISAVRPTEDVFIGDDYTQVIGSQDVTGLSINDTSARYFVTDGSGNKIPLPDIAAYNLGAETRYGKAIISPDLVYDRPVIFNARLNATGDGMDLFLDGVDLGVTLNPALVNEANPETFRQIFNSRYWIGRSEFFGPSFTGDFLEIMSFSERKSDLDRIRTESYLAIKYGITLGLYPVESINLPHVPGVYYDSAGNPLWNPSDDNGYTYNVTGIGRDDCSFLDQRQAKSVDPNTFITIGLGSIAPTNNLNPNTFQDDGDYLMWGSTPFTVEASEQPLEVTLGANLVTTFTDVTKRTWKFKEWSQMGNDIPTVQLTVETVGLTDLPPLVGNDAYVMIVADDDVFSTNVETIFLETNGALQQCFYDFDDIKYVKFGVAHEVVAPRHIDFDGASDYIGLNDELDLGSTFTISAWILSHGNNTANTDRTIVSKRSGSADGYQFFITTDNKVGMRSNANDVMNSASTINNDKWTYVAYTYDGSVGRMYIDGVLDSSQSISNPIPNASRFTIGSRFIDKNNIPDSFNGKIDELRMFSTALSVEQLRFMMNQELLKDGTSIKGTIIPTSVTKNDIATLEWDFLDAYFNMNTYIGTHLNDASGKGHRGSLISPENFEIQVQSAPLPYVTAAKADWDDFATWENANEMYIPGSTRVINGNVVDIDWNIVRVQNNARIDNADVNLLGLEIVDGVELTVSNEKGLNISHLLQLKGALDLQDRSQLIQTDRSDLVTGDNGYLERDQQGTSDGYSYNYWSSPVSTNSLSPNTTFTIRNVVRDGTDPNTPRDLNFTDTDTPDAIPGDPNGAALTVSARWLYKYSNLASGVYANWQYVGPDGPMNAGEGWSMKGSFRSEGPQNYVFTGKPNNGDINLSIAGGNDYLIGNPYPSALDANQFLMDNPALDGTLYFWEHWGGGSHILKQYQGGYATYNLSGGVGNATIGTSHPLVNSGGSPTKLPKRYIPIAQGFFVTGQSTGTINFNNTQRKFEKENGGQSVFTSAPGSTTNYNSQYNSYDDHRTKIRLGFDSPNLIHRQLLVTVDTNATAGYDRGYDGLQYQEQFDDMSWTIGDKKYTIQGIDTINEETVLPLHVVLRDNGTIKIKVDHINNLAPNLTPYIWDQQEDSYTSLYDQDYESQFLFRGTYKDRFSLTFKNSSTLSSGDAVLANNNILVFKPSSQRVIKVKNPSQIRVLNMTLINTLGQTVKAWKLNAVDQEFSLEYNGLPNGIYMVSVELETGNTTFKLLLD